MPAKWSRPVFSFRFYDGKISCALIVIQHLGGKRNARRLEQNLQPFDRRVFKGSLLRCHKPLLVQSGVSLRRINLVANGLKRTLLGELRRTNTTKKRVS